MKLIVEVRTVGMVGGVLSDHLVSALQDLLLTRAF